LLPKYRGASPIQSAILNGETETGVTIMKMDVGLDTGDILTQRATPIADEDNAATLHDRLAQLGGELLVATIPRLRRRKNHPATPATRTRHPRRQDQKGGWPH
jgi:methionyl-tRNA formyltransferase